MNILILTSDLGGGHIRATEAINEHLKLKNPNYNIKILNTIDYINPSFNKLITSIYTECVKKYPSLFGKMYYYAEEEHVPINMFSLILKSLSKKLLPIISNFKTDVIISTHPFSTEMVSYLKNDGKIKNTKLINLLTDYAPHKFWIHRHVDAYITATEQMTEDMIKRGVNKNIIYPIGIPVRPIFLNSYERKDVLNSIGFNEDSFTILLMSGSFGVDHVLKIFKILVNLNKELQIIIITGNNNYLYHKFEHLIANNKNKSIKFHLIKYTDNVSKYMKICDVLVTKPGGLTTTEAIFSQLPIIFFDAYPGQEEKNADFILKNKIGMRISDSEENINSFIELIENRQILNKMKENILSIQKQNFIDNLIKIIDTLKSNEIKKSNYKENNKNKEAISIS